MNIEQAIRQRRAIINHLHIIVEERFYNIEGDFFTDWTPILETPNAEWAFGLLKVD